MIHLEDHHHGPRFLEIDQQGRWLTRRFGRLGETGTQRKVRLKSPLDAKKQTHRAILKAQAKGYWPGRHNLDLIQAIRQNPDDQGAY